MRVECIGCATQSCTDPYCLPIQNVSIECFGFAFHGRRDRRDPCVRIANGRFAFFFVLLSFSLCARNENLVELQQLFRFVS